MDTGGYIQRTVEPVLRGQLERGKRVLLLGARQTGKTTLLARIDAALRLSLVQPAVRQRYEREPGVLTAEIEAAKTRRTDARLPLVVIDDPGVYPYRSSGMPSTPVVRARTPPAPDSRRPSR